MRSIVGIAGLAFALAAAALGLFYPSKSALIALFSSIALVLLVYFLLTHFEAFKAFSRRRATQLGLNSALMVVFFVFIVVMLNLIVSQYYFRADLSATGVFTLSPQTESVVGGLEEEATVLAFLRGGGREAARARAMLDGYRYINHRLLFNVYDLDAVPTIAQKYGVDKYDTSVVLMGDRSVKVDGVDEEAVTNGIIRVTRREKKTVYFLEGHGERGLGDEGRNGVKRAADSLAAMGYEVRKLNLASAGSVPADAAAVVVAGPRASFSESETQVMRNYSFEGSLLLMLDMEGEKMTDFIGGFGLPVLEGLVSEPEKKLAGADDKVPLVDSYPPSPVTGGFGLTTVFPTAFGFQKSGAFTEYEYRPLVMTSDKSSAVVEQGEDAKKSTVKGPIAISMLVKARGGKGRLIVFGDSDFVANDYLGVHGNGNLFRNAVSYLVGETDLVSIEPRRAEFVPLYITESQARTITYALMAGPPLFIAAVGTALWLRRRKL